MKVAPVALLLVIGACRTLPAVKPLGLAPADQPALGTQLVVLPVACSERPGPPTFWGAEWETGSLPCVQDVASQVAALVDTELAARAFHVARGDLSVASFEALGPDERQRVFDQLHADAVVRIAVSSWREVGARVTIVVATRDRAFARVATCEAHMFSNAGAQVIAADRVELAATAARCATGRIPARTGAAPPPVVPTEDGRP